MVWILGRIYCTGTPEDYKAVHAMQDKISLVPLSAYGKPYTPPAGKVDPSIDMKTAGARPGERAGRDGLLQAAGAADEGQSARRRGCADGREDGEDRHRARDSLSTSTSSRPTRSRRCKDVPKAASARSWATSRMPGSANNGWMFITKTGIYGTDYLDRALVTAIGLGANRPQDAVYPTSEVDADGKPYAGANKYVMHFDKGQMPPVNGFWSLTMYDAEYFFVDNPLNRYTLSARNKLKHNADGSVDLYLQHENPGQGQGIQLAAGSRRTSSS